MMFSSVVFCGSAQFDGAEAGGTTMTVGLSPGLPGWPGVPGVPDGPAGPGTATGVAGTFTTVGFSQAARPTAATSAAINMERFMVNPLSSVGNTGRGRF